MRSLTALIIMAACVAGWLYANDRDFREATATQERRDYRAWAERQCLPQGPRERAVIEQRDDGATQCTRYINAGYGRAPILVYAEVRP